MAEKRDICSKKKDAKIYVSPVAVRRSEANVRQ
jgi:hypothetical protein